MYDSPFRRLTAFTVRHLVALATGTTVLSPASAATFTVTTTSDLASDPSLRRAINDANLNPGPDVIVFSLPPGPPTIVPLSPLPEILGAVLIDGRSGGPCLGAVGPRVGIDGVMAGPLANGLTVNTPGSVSIRGLAIYRFSGAGVAIVNSVGGRLEGNFLGTDVSGQAAGLGNRVGLELSFARDYTVGGDDPCDRNLISGNVSEGVWLNGPLFVSQNNRVVGNLIGVTRDGWPLPNGSHGIYFFGGPTGNRIEANVIAHNAGAGVLVLEGLDNGIAANSIYANGRLGIDLSPADSPNGNDLLDADEGPNRGQNHPILGAAGGVGGVVSGASGTHIEGFLNSEPGKVFAVHFYWSPVCDPSGFGEGRYYLGQTSVSTDAAGNVNFAADFPETVPVGALVTATATHPLGSTSEFSPCAMVTSSGQGVVHHSGLPHSGGAPLPEGWWSVPVGSDGRSAAVRIGLGRVTGWQGELREVELREFGDRVAFMFGDETNAPEPPEEMYEAAKELWAEVSPREPSLIVAALTNGSTWLRFTLYDAANREVYTGHPGSSAARFTLASNNDVVDISQAGYLQLPDGERSLRIEFRNPIELGVPSVGERWSTRSIVLVVRRDSASGTKVVPPETIRSAGIRYHRAVAPGSTPFSFRLGEELIQQFGHLHGALNQSTIAGWRWRGSPGGTGEPARVTFPAASVIASLPRDAAGGWDEGGIMLRLDPSRYICIDLEWDAAAAGSPFLRPGEPVIALPPFLQIRIGTNHVLPPAPDRMAIRQLERGWSIEPRFDLSGALSNRYAFYRAGVFVGSVDAITDTVVVARSAPIRFAYSTSVSPAGAPGFHLRWGAETRLGLEVPAGVGPAFDDGLVADELRIIPLGSLRPLSAFTRIDVAGAGVPWFEMNGEDGRASRVDRLLVQKVRNGIQISVPTELGRPYQLEFAPALNASSAQGLDWQVIERFVGDGAVREWTPATRDGASREGFFRLGGF